MNGSLCGGAAGLALFFSNIANSPVGRGKSDLDLARSFLLKSAELQSLDTSFAEGISGFAWAAAHMPALLTTPESEFLHSRLEAALLRETQSSATACAVGLLDGLIGIGVYALERRSMQLLSNIVEKLDSLRIDVPYGGTWETPTSLFEPRREYG